MWIIPKSSMFCHFVPATEASSLDLAKYSEILSDALLWRSKHSQPATWLLRLISRAGKRKGKADPRHLWPFIRDHIRAIRPVFVICENVAGHLSLGFDRVVSDLDDLGYTTSPGIYAAEEVGAPHRRERLFIVAYRECDGLSRFLRQAGYRQDRTQQRQNPDGQSARDGGDGPALGDTSEFGLEGQRPQRREQVVADGASKELADAERVGRRGWDNGEPAGSRRPLQTEGSGSMAHAKSRRCGQEGQCEADPANGIAGSGSVMDNADRRRHGGPEKEICSGGTPLSMQAQLWSTPNVPNRGPESRESKQKRGAGGINLQTQAANWPTVTAQDAKNNAGPSQFNRNTQPLNVAVVSDGRLDQDSPSTNGSSRGSSCQSPTIKYSKATLKRAMNHLTHHSWKGFKYDY